MGFRLHKKNTKKGKHARGTQRTLEAQKEKKRGEKRRSRHKRKEDREKEKKRRKTLEAHRTQNNSRQR